MNTLKSNESINIIKEVKPKNGGLLHLLENTKNFEVNTVALVCDILSLPEFKRNPNVSFELIELAVNKGLYDQMIQDEFSHLIGDGDILVIDDIVDKINTISKKILGLCLRDDLALLQDYAYILETIYAKGLGVSEILTLILRVLNNKIHSKRYDVDGIRNRMALATYSANEFNFMQKLEELDECAHFIKRNKLQILNGPMHYYFALFKDEHPNCSSTVYNNDCKHTSYWHIQKSKNYMFELAKLRVEYS